MMRKQLAALALLILAACTRPPVSEDVTIQFYDDRDDVLITAETKFDLESKNPRVNAARQLALAGTDPWSVRFGRVNPALDQVTFERQHGELARVTHVVRIPAEDLHRVFSDTAVTVQLLRGEGLRELVLIPGTSARASREQQRQFEEQLETWSRDVARYFIAIDHLYDYMDDNPHRAEVLFEALVSDKENEEEPVVTEDELPFVEAVIHAMETIAMRMDQSERDATSFAEVADMIYNPFPARITLRAPDEKDLVIEPVDLLDAVGKLEGKWISPDPLAALLKNEVPAAADLAAMPRKTTPSPSGTEIAAAIREQLARPKTYTYRWRD